MKPGFFNNEDLCALSPWHRICFEGLWCCADRDGRVQDRPKRLKAEIFPYDELNMDALLWDLSRAGFIVRYQIDAQPLIWIPTWGSHQFPRKDEAPSRLAPYASGSERTTATLDATTYPACRPIVTNPHLISDSSASDQRMGSGIWDLGSGEREHGDSAADAASSPEATRKTRDAFRAQDLIDLWNETTKPPIPRCRELTDDRRRKIRTRIAARPSMAEWREGFEAIQAGAFYRGENDRGWVADFDWVVKNDTVIAKVLERARTRRPAPNRECPHEPMCANRTACIQRTIADDRAARGVAS